MSSTLSPQLLQELTAESEFCAVTALDLRRNGLTTLPLELLRLTALTTLHFDEGNPALDPTLAKIQAAQGLPAVLLRRRPARRGIQSEHLGQGGREERERGVRGGEGRERGT